MLQKIKELSHWLVMLAAIGISTVASLSVYFMLPGMFVSLGHHHSAPVANVVLVATFMVVSKKMAVNRS